MTRRAIAKATGWDKEAIRLLERSGLRKMRALLGVETLAAVRALLARDRVTATPKNTKS